MSKTDEADVIYAAAAELFGVIATPMRLKIIAALCQGERNVSELLEHIDCTQPNMSQHLAALYRAGVVSRRKDGASVYYAIKNEQVVTICRAVCTQVAIDRDEDGATLIPPRRSVRSARKTVKAA